MLLLHPVPPANGLLLFLDDSPEQPGIHIAWLFKGLLRTAPLGLPSAPATSVSNIRFSPDSSAVACLVTLAYGHMPTPQNDPLRRLRGWHDSSHVTFFPCEDCTVQVIDLHLDQNSLPAPLEKSTFSHVFVPEYGFDMVWRAPDELAFAAFLHSEKGAATYLVRWRNLRHPHRKNFVFMACIEGVCAELVYDRRDVVEREPETRFTCRIELSNDAKHVFFDTVSKFGILKFDQVENSSTAKVTRADLPNHVPRTDGKSNYSLQGRRMRETAGTGSPSSVAVTRPADSKTGRRWGRDEQTFLTPRSLLHPHAIADFEMGRDFRVNRMSMDGQYLCSVIDLQDLDYYPHMGFVTSKRVEMRSSVTGKLMYRKIVRKRSHPNSTPAKRLPLEKSGEIACETMSFSDDSTLLVLWDSVVSSTECLVLKNLPVVLDVSTGELVQDFRKIPQSKKYETIQASPDCQTLYATRMANEFVCMDAIDVLAGKLMKTVRITGPVRQPDRFSPHGVYMLPNRHLRAVARGKVDVLFDSTRGSVGCGWKHHR